MARYTNAKGCGTSYCRGMNYREHFHCIDCHSRVSSCHDSHTNMTDDCARNENIVNLFFFLLCDCGSNSINIYDNVISNKYNL